MQHIRQEGSLKAGQQKRSTLIYEVSEHQQCQVDSGSICNLLLTLTLRNTGAHHLNLTVGAEMDLAQLYENSVESSHRDLPLVGTSKQARPCFRKNKTIQGTRIWV